MAPSDRGHRSRHAPRWRVAPCSRAVSPRLALGAAARSPAATPASASSGGGARSPRPTTRSAGRSATSTTSDRVRADARSRGSTLRIYNYADYLSPRVLKDFEKKYGVDIRLSTFNDADEALTKIAPGTSGSTSTSRATTRSGRLVQAELLRPLNQDYLTNTRQPVGRLPRPVVRPRLRSTPGPTRSTAPASAGATDRVPEDVGDARQPLRRLLGHRSTRATWRSSTTGTPRWAWCCCATGLDMNSTDAERHRAGPRAAAGAAATRWTRR